MLVLVAERSLASGDEGQQTVAAQKEGSSDPSNCRQILCQDGDRTGRTDPLDPFKKLTTRLFLPTDWPYTGACEAAIATT